MRLGEKKPAVKPIQARSPDEVQRNPGSGKTFSPQMNANERKGILVCSPDAAQRNPGIQCKPEYPDFTSLHPGYEARLHLR